MCWTQSLNLNIKQKHQQILFIWTGGSPYSLVKYVSNLKFSFSLFSMYKVNACIETNLRHLNMSKFNETGLLSNEVLIKLVGVFPLWQTLLMLTWPFSKVYPFSIQNILVLGMSMSKLRQICSTCLEMRAFQRNTKS